MQKTIILKFGGTSVSTASSIATIVRNAKKYRSKNPVIVVSALSGVTESLLNIQGASSKKIFAGLSVIRHKHALLTNDVFLDAGVRKEVMNYIDAQLQEIANVARKRKTPRNLDRVMSFGEIMSSFLISRALREAGLPSKQVIASDVIVTDDSFTNAEFLPKETQIKARGVLSPLIARGFIPVVTGFIGATKNGRITTLGRGGSDYSASIIGHSLEAREIQIWTDVDGIFTADPRIVKEAKLIKHISYREASEMAAFGAKVLHPRTIRPAVEKNIPVRVRNTLRPENDGTLVTSKLHGVGLKAIAFRERVILVNIYSSAMLFSQGFLARVFGIFAKHGISVDLVSVSEVSISVTLDNMGNLDRAISELQRFSTVSLHRSGFGVISLIGERIIEGKKIMRNTFAVLQKHKVQARMISMGASDINISVVIPSRDIVRIARAIHNRLIPRKV